MKVTCSVCGDNIDTVEDGGAWEEGTDDYWCVPCIYLWELNYKEEWATGRPLNSRDKSGV